MKFISTRSATLEATVAEALEAGLAPDGGLYVPTALPRFDAGALRADISLPECATRVLAPFFDGSALAERLDSICRDALDLPLPIEPLTTNEQDAPAWMMELFHGPTAAFKDFAAQAACQETGGKILECRGRAVKELHHPGRTAVSPA